MNLDTVLSGSRQIRPFDVKNPSRTLTLESSGGALEKASDLYRRWKMERTPSTPYSRIGGLAALSGSLLMVGSMFMPWVDTAGGGSLNYWQLAGVDGVQPDTRTYVLSLALMLLLVVWCALYFTLHTHETRSAWAFGTLAGAMIMYGTDLRISEDLPASSLAVGEVVAAVGLFLVVAGSITALAANIPEPVPVHQHRTGKASL
jgi:hypothetical protein